MKIALVNGVNVRFLPVVPSHVGTVSTNERRCYKTGPLIDWDRFHVIFDDIQKWVQVHLDKIYNFLKLLKKSSMYISFLQNIHKINITSVWYEKGCSVACRL